MPAESYGIPVRGPRWHSAAELTEKHYMPTVLVLALIGQGEWERLQRFAAVAQYRSCTEAEKELNTRRSTLGHQIRKFCGTLGRPILIPTTGHKPLGLTRFGRRVLAVVDDLAERGGP
jgi:hypothetical protein